LRSQAAKRVRRRCSATRGFPPSGRARPRPRP
jgi:hypothetical protein